jgi:hypothetical protein
VNGDRLVLVIGRADTNLIPEQQSIWDASIVGTGGDIADAVDRLLRARRSGGATIHQVGNGVCEHFKSSAFRDTCPACVRTLTQLLACIFAGGAATAHLLPDQHAESQLRHDLAQANDLLQKAFTNEEQRKCLGDQAQQKANELIKRESKAIQKLASELLVRGVLDGPEAEQIIRNNLQISSF